jgi:hypothetical protein
MDLTALKSMTRTLLEAKNALAFLDHRYFWDFDDRRRHPGRQALALE